MLHTASLKIRSYFITISGNVKRKKKDFFYLTGPTRLRTAAPWQAKKTKKGLLKYELAFTFSVNTRRYILNSDVFADNMSVDDRVKLNTLEINERSKAGLTLRSMRLDSLNLKDVASVQAILNKLHKDMPSEDLQKLRNQIQIFQKKRVFFQAGTCISLKWDYITLNQKKYDCGVVAQLVRVPPCHGGCCGFESRQFRHFF